MTPNMRATIELVLRDEGGVADVGDGKGVTAYGQTRIWLDHWGLQAPQSRDHAVMNYETVWVRTHIADVIDRDATLGYVLATFATHADERFAIAAMQRELGVEADGQIGAITLQALDAAPVDAIAHGLVAAYAERLGEGLASEKRDRRKFARGWLNRLARLIRALA